MCLDSKRAGTIFLELVELAKAERDVALDKACGNDIQLRSRVESLLLESDMPSSSHTDQEGLPKPDPSSSQFTSDQLPPTADSQPEPFSPGSFNSPGNQSQDRTVDHVSSSESVPQINERYLLQKKIGEGGMGEVWVARQSEPVKRQVAIKLIKRGMDSQAVLARFEQERQALAMMDHPNIAKILDGGVSAAGQPFFVMELVNGTPLTTFCDHEKLSPRKRLDLFQTICNAVQHAHQKGIVHRDLKPANILVMLVDGYPVAKVIDFGVAKATGGKLTDQSLATQFGAVVGTLEYMSPEQASLSCNDVDTRADIYSLGVILYELLTGLRPIDASRLNKAAFSEMVRIIQEEEPSKPSTRLSTHESLPSLAAVRQVEPRKLMAMLRGELDWVVLKCLEKSRDRRYDSASGLAQDIGRYLCDEPVLARPPTLGYRLGKLIRRNKGLTITAGLVAAALLVGILGTTLGLLEAKRQRQVALEQAGAAEDARGAEERQRKAAERANRQAINALQSFTSSTMEKLLGSRQEITSNERAVLQEALKQWEAFADARGDSAVAQEIRAQGSANVSRIFHKLGKSPEAILSDRKTLKIWSDLKKQFPNNEEYRRRVGLSHQDLAATLRSAGQRTDAGQHFRWAHACFDKLVDDYPEKLDYQSLLATTLMSVGNIERDLGNWAASTASYMKAMETNRQLAKLDPDREVYREDIARSQWGLASVYERQNLNAESFRCYRQAIATYETLRVQAPDNLDYQLYTADLCRELGISLSDDGKDIEGLDQLQRALPIREKVAKQFPSIPDYRLQLARILRDLANVHRYLENLDQAQTHATRSIEILEVLTQDHPSVLSYQSALGLALQIRAEIKYDRELPQDALASLTESIEVLQAARDQEPEHLPVQRSLSRSYEFRAYLLSEAGRTKAAIEDWRRALDSCHDDDRISLQIELAQSQLAAGDIETALTSATRLSELDTLRAGNCFGLTKLFASASTKDSKQANDCTRRALDMLLRAVELGFDRIDLIEGDEELLSLADEDIFKALTRRLHASQSREQ